MGLPASPWDDPSFASKGDITCGVIACTNWQTARLHQIGVTVYILTDMFIDLELDQYPDAELLGPFTSANAYVEPLRICKKIYIPAPFSGSF